MNSKIPKQIYFIMALELSSSLSMSIIRPIFPLYMKNLGASIFDIGLLITITSVATLFSRIPFSLLSDRVQRWPIVALGMLSSFLYLLLLSFIPNVALLYLLQTFRAIASSGFMPTTRAIASDLAPSNRRAETLGLILTTVGLSSMLGPALTSLLVNYLNYQQIFLLVAVFPLVGFVSLIAARNFAWISIKQRRREARVTAEKIRLFDIFKIKNMANLCFCALSFQIAEGVFETLFSVHAKENLNMAASQISLLFSLRGLTNTLIRLPTGKISDKIGRSKPFYMAASLLMLTYIFLSMANNFFLLCIVMIIYGIGFGIRKVISNTMFVENVPPENRAVSLSIRFSAMSVGNATGSLVAGAAAMVLPTTFIFGLCSLAILAGLVSFKLMKFDLKSTR